MTTRALHEPIIAPSILAADCAYLADEVAEIAPVVPMIHVDVMDGHFVPNITFGADTVRYLRATTDLRFDCHLQITDPATYGPQMLAAGGDSVTFHPSTVEDPRALIDRLHEEGGEVGIAIRPSERAEQYEPLFEHVDLVLTMTVEPGFGGQSFMPQVLPKIVQIAEWRERHGARWRLEVDGGIAPATIARTAAAGADVFVAGTAIFGQPDRAAAANDLLALVRAARADGAVPEVR